MISIGPIIAITRLAIRTAVRNRACLWMTAGIATVTVGLPFLLHGDGTAIGHMRVAVAYPLTIAFTFLVLGTLWLSAGLVSLEISGRQLQSVAVKPPRTIEIVLGKWLGILAINACLVLVTILGMLLSTAVLEHRYRRAPAERAAVRRQVLTARRILAPDASLELSREAEQLHARLSALGQIPQETKIEHVYRDLKARNAMVSPGDSLTWLFRMPEDVTGRAEAPLSLRYRFRCNALERTPVSGSWTLDAKDGAPVIIPMEGVLDGEHHQMLPHGLPPGADTIAVTFSHRGGPDAPILFFDPDMPVSLLTHESSFAANLFRADLAIFCFLATIAAVGLLMSTLFSFPVATFTAAAILFTLVLASSFSAGPTPHHHDHAEEAGAITKMAEPMLLAANRATAGITGNIPIHDVADGALYSWKQVRECILLLLVVIPALSGALASLVLARKELAA
jgi:ABC-type transport system involved in multi-copper enzyme maturation permease subunit